jgi:pre-mRNA-splicing factor SYF1
VQARLFKSLKLWSFYVDLEESLGTVESTKAVYDKILELRIANAQIIVNYSAFLEENKYFEECFKVYERGVELFTFPVSFEIWNIYLSKFVKRYVSFFLHTFCRTGVDFCSGWLETGESTRFV